MSIASLKDLYLDELGDLYDAENQMIRALPRLAEAAHAPELKEALVRHCDESRLHLERLQLIFTHWGERAPLRRCEGLAGIVQEADKRLTEPATDDARDAAIIGAAQRMEHYEIASYGSARTYARRLNRDDEARLLQETLDEEGRADTRLTEIADAHVVDDARAETDFAAATPSQLRYIDTRSLDYRRLAEDALEIRNDADEKLGTFDGLLVDARSGAPRYVVASASGVFAWRRSIMPVAMLRYDARSRVLRIALDKDIAARFPEFDRDAFATLNPQALDVYEGKLLNYFDEDQGRRVPRWGGGEVPEWLMTGVWINLPPERAREVSDDTRSFVNEFDPTGNERSRAPEQPVLNAGEVGSDTPSPIDPDDTPTPPHGEKLR